MTGYNYVQIHIGGQHYVYVFSQYSYSGKTNAKIGVSKNPEKRRFYPDIGGFSFYKKFPTDRKTAFAIEAAAKKHFKKYLKIELLAATPAEVCEFIEGKLNNAVV